jgi:hypothetical protein
MARALEQSVVTACVICSPGACFMRDGTILTALFVLLFSSTARAQEEKGTRYGIALDLKSFPQSTAKEALASVIKAIDDKKVAYLVAQLADPAFVDDRVKRLYGGKFDEQIHDTQRRLDPSTVKQLKRFLKEGKWTITATSAAVQLDEIKDRCVRLVRKDGRWYMEHRFAP